MTPRAAIMLAFGAFGISAGAVAGAMAYVTRHLDVASYELGIGFMASSIAAVAVMAMGGRIGRHASNRAAMLFALPVIAAVTFLMLTASSQPVFFAAMVVHGGVMGLCDVFMNAEASAIEHETRKPIFTAFHGMVSIAIAAGAILSSYLVESRGPWSMSLVVALCLAASALAVSTSVPARRLELTEHAPLADLARNVPLLLMGAIVGISIVMETSAMFWSARLLDEQAPELARIAGLGAAFYGGCNALVRFNGDRLRARFGEIPLMLTSLSVAALGLMGLGLSFSFAANVVSFAAVGLGLAITCPCLFNMAASEVPHNRAGGIGFVSLVAGGPRILGPYAFGWIASLSSTGVAFGCGGVLLVIALALLLALKTWLPQPARSA
jgi:MFS family permease